MLTLNTPHTPPPFPCLPRLLLAGKPRSCSMAINDSGFGARREMYEPRVWGQGWVGALWPHGPRTPHGMQLGVQHPQLHSTPQHPWAPPPCKNSLSGKLFL